ncbi:hypothetical protein HZA96_00520 [Candidatus Woesearchaeota archaeon]|nr:hypothetical protein [Candidatus Woesearchaeota archaeon]
MGIERLFGFGGFRLRNTAVYSAFALLGAIACGGTEGIPQPKDEDGYSVKDNGYQADVTNPTLDVPPTYDEGIVDTYVPPQDDGTVVVPDTFVDKDEVTWLDSADLIEEKDDGLTIEDLLETKDDGQVVDTFVEKDEGVVDVPVVQKYAVTLNIEDILSGKNPENLNYSVKDMDGKVVASGVGGTQVFKLEKGQYSVLVTDNPTKITEFEYNVGKKLNLIGNYLTDFNNVLTILSAEGFDNVTINVKLTEFNQQSIGKYFDLEFVIDVNGDMEVKKQMIMNNELDVPLVLENGTVNVENTYYFMLRVWGLQPLISDGYTKSGQWSTAPNPIKVYIEEKSSSDGKLNYKNIAIEALNLWGEKAGIQLYQLVDNLADAQVNMVFDSSAPNSKTKFDEISFDPISGDPVFTKMSVIIKPKNTYQEILHTVSHEFHHVNTGTGELIIQFTVGNNSSQLPTQAEGYNIASAVSAKNGFNTLEYITK